jgi:superfamily I DNA and RNA helicase
MSWLLPFAKLDSEQRDIINRILANPKQNFFIQGFAGSGKSILLLSGLTQLAQNGGRGETPPRSN